MKFISPHLACLGTALTLGASAQVHKEQCDPIPKEQWKTQAQLERKLINIGWKIRRVKIYNGCYEVYAFDDRGGRVEVFFHPKTLERVIATE